MEGVAKIHNGKKFEIRPAILYTIIVIVATIVTNIVAATTFFNTLEYGVETNKMGVRNHLENSSVHMKLKEKLEVFVTRKEYEELLKRFDRLEERLDQYLTNKGY